MTIKQKAREIAELAQKQGCVGYRRTEEAARLGLIEGVKMAAKVVHSEGHEGLATAIRALIEEYEK